jgi:hypothetical protein
LQRVALAAEALVHFTNLPFASRQCVAAATGADPVIRPSTDKAMMSLGILLFPSRWKRETGAGVEPAAGASIGALTPAKPSSLTVALSHHLAGCPLSRGNKSATVAFAVLHAV